MLIVNILLFFYCRIFYFLIFFVLATISLSPHVRSAIIVGNSVHLIADEKTIFPIGQRSFTSPASVMQPFKTQLNGTTIMNPYGNNNNNNNDLSLFFFSSKFI